MTAYPRAGRGQRTPAVRTVTLLLHVQPGARTNEIVGRHGDALKVRIAAPPVDNKANVALIAFLSHQLGVQKSAIVIRQGAGSRRKVVEISGGPQLAATLDALAVSSTR